MRTLLSCVIATKLRQQLLTLRKQSNNYIVLTIKNSVKNHTYQNQQVIIPNIQSPIIAVRTSYLEIAFADS